MTRVEGFTSRRIRARQLITFGTQTLWLCLGIIIIFVIHAIMVIEPFRKEEISTTLAELSREEPSADRVEAPVTWRVDTARDTGIRSDRDIRYLGPGGVPSAHGVAIESLPIVKACVPEGTFVTDETRLSGKPHYLISFTLVDSSGLELILENVLYHRCLGVDFVVVTTCEDPERVREVLKPLISEGSVEVVKLRCTPKTLDLFLLSRTRIMADYAKKGVWLALIDIDEFYVVRNGTCSLASYLSQAPPDAGSVAAPWYFFGPSFHESKPEGLVIENYIYRDDNYLPQGTNIIRGDMLKPKVLRKVCRAGPKKNNKNCPMIGHDKIIFNAKDRNFRHALHYNNFTGVGASFENGMDYVRRFSRPPRGARTAKAGDFVPPLVQHHYRTKSIEDLVQRAIRDEKNLGRFRPRDTAQWRDVVRDYGATRGASCVRCLIRKYFPERPEIPTGRPGNWSSELSDGQNVARIIRDAKKRLNKEKKGNTPKDER